MYGTGNSCFSQHLSLLYSLNTFFSQGNSVSHSSVKSSRILGSPDSEPVTQEKTIFNLVFRAEACELILLVMVMLRRWDHETVYIRLQSQRKTEFEETSCLQICSGQRLQMAHCIFTCMENSELF